MSEPSISHVNVGAYDRPFSGVGIEFDPLGSEPGRSGIILHETGYLPVNEDWNFPGVFSPFWRLYYNSNRGHCLVIDDYSVELTPDHIVLVPPRCLFHCLGRNRVSTNWIHFSFTRRLHRDIAPPVLLAPRDTELCLLRDLRNLILDDKDWQPTQAIYRNSLALLQVVISRPELQWQPPLPENLEKVRRYIDGHLAARLTSVALAKMAGSSLAGFGRAFRRHFDASPAVYVTQTRVREAARLLLHTEESIEQVAEQTGFPNRAYFSRVFKRVTNESPARFRTRHSRI